MEASKQAASLARLSAEPAGSSAPSVRASSAADAKKLQETNAALMLAIKCVKCCLYCFEKSLKFITNYCYIYVALQGSSFCSACIKTFGLITSQPAQLALNTFVRVVLGLIQTAGITVFWHNPPAPEEREANPATAALPFVAVFGLLAVIGLVTIQARPLMDFLTATSQQIYDPAAYTGAVLRQAEGMP